MPTRPPAQTKFEFASGLTGTLTLTTGQLKITDSLTIDGPGAANLTINGNNQSRIFYIDDGSGTTNINVEIDGLTLTGGSRRAPARMPVAAPSSRSTA